MRILVTGGTGYIGSHTVVALLEAGHQVISVDNLSNSDIYVNERIVEISGLSPSFFEVDLCDQAKLRNVFAQAGPIDGVIHFAAFKAVGESVAKPLLYYQNNVTGLLNLLACMTDFGVGQLVFSSSCTVYGEPDALPVTEMAPLRPAQSPYGATKQMGEQIIGDWVRATPNARALLLRYFNPIGAHPSGKIGEWPRGVPNNLVPFITQTAAGLRDRLQIFGSDYPTPDGTCIRDYIHVCDLADTHVLGLAKLPHLVSGGQVRALNVGTGSGTSVLEAVSAFERANGVPVPRIFAPRREGDVVQIWADATTAMNVLEWSPRFSLDEAMRTAWLWEQNLRKHI